MAKTPAKSGRRNKARTPPPQPSLRNRSNSIPPPSPSNLTDKQEAFCVAYAEHGNAADAYREAFDVAPTAKRASSRAEAAKLLQRPEVARRIAEIQDNLRDLTLYSMQKAHEDLEALKQRALKANKLAVVKDCIAQQMRLHGLGSDRLDMRHAGHDGGPLPLASVPDAELLAEARKLASALGLKLE